MCSSPTGSFADLIEAYVKLTDIIVALDGLASLRCRIHGVNLFDELEEFALLLSLLLGLLSQVLLRVLEVFLGLLRRCLGGEPALARAGKESTVLGHGPDWLEARATEWEF